MSEWPPHFPFPSTFKKFKEMRILKMHKILIYMIVFVSTETLCSIKHSYVDKTELVLAFMLHRHGDRTPVDKKLMFACDRAEVLKRTNKYGFGQLTDKGRLRAYKLGKFIRRRYGAYLSNQFNQSEIFIRSTDSMRSKMTVLIAMAAVYPPGRNNWSKDINWTPVPYTTVPLKYDHMLLASNCPVIIEHLKVVIEGNIPGMDKYNPLLNELSIIYGRNLKQRHFALFFVYDTLLCQLGLGVPLTSRLKQLFPKIKEAAYEVFHLLFDESFKPLRTGVLLKEFFDAVDKAINGEVIQKIHVYSAHDSTLSGFTTALNIAPLGLPEFGALFSLELRREVTTGRYIVVPVFLKNPYVDEVYVQVEGCEGFCDLESFSELTSKYIRSNKQRRAECEFNEDIEIDSSII